MGLIKDIKELIYADEILDNTRLYYKKTNDIIKNNLNKNEEYSAHYSINDQAKEIIKDYILNGNYNKQLKPLALKLYEYTETENLLNCYLNIRNVKVNKEEKYKLKRFSLKDQYIAGVYDAAINTISYYDDDTLSHEFLHMCSTPNIESDDYYTTGFKIMGDDIEYARGMNEGYTDLLNRRIFFNEDYNTDTSYKINVYLLRIFELLYDDYKTMERDYFISNYQSPIGNFMKYGSIDEFFKFTTYLDWFAFTEVIDDEDKEIFDLLKKVVKRCSTVKYLKAEEITEEYFESEKKGYQKILKL